MSNFTPSGAGGATGFVNIVGVTVPTVENVLLPTAGIEVAHALPANTKRFAIRLRGAAAVLKLAYAPGASGTDFVTIATGSFYEEEDIGTATLTIYLQASVSVQTAEIVSWV